MVDEADWEPRPAIFPAEWLELVTCPACGEDCVELVWCDRHQQFECEDCWVEGQITFWGS